MSLSTQSNSKNISDRRSRFRRTREIAVFAMLGTIMFCSKIIMEALPNIHLLGMLTMVYTIVFRRKALIPIYIYVFLNGVFAGFDVWWFPYLYIWTILWGITMLLPKHMPKSIAVIVYPTVCAIHGLAFGALYAPAQAIMVGMNFEQTVAWVIAGLGFDILHCAGNIFAGLFIYPISKTLCKLNLKN